MPCGTIPTPRPSGHLIGSELSDHAWYSNVNATQITEDLLVEEYTKLDTRASLDLGRPGQRKLGGGLLSLGRSPERPVPCCKESVG